MNINGTELHIPYNENDLQLYNMKGSKKAAETLTRVLKRSLTLIEKLVSKGKGIKEAAYEANDKLRITRYKLAQYGASDTEPRCVGAECISVFCGLRYDIDSNDVYDEIN